MKLSTRLTIAMVALVLFTAAAVGLFTYRDLESAILPQELEQLRSHSRLRARELEAYVRGAHDDVLGNRGASMIASIVRAHTAGGVDPTDGSQLQTWLTGISRRLITELESKRAYYQFRIVGLADGGREIMRVERSQDDGSIRLVADSELLRVGNRAYFQEAMKLVPGEVYFSQIELHREHGLVAFPLLPALHVATPLQTADGKPFGLMVINVDMRPIFDRMRVSSTTNSSIYIVNEQGDFLVHPDRSREFVFEFGGTRRIQNDYPRFGELFGKRHAESHVTTDVEGQRIALAASSAVFSAARRVIVAESTPYAAIMAPVNQARWSLVFATLLACLAAIACAIFLSRSLSGPLARMTAAVSAFSRGQQMTAPTASSGEVGVLAQAFARMAAEIKSGDDKVKDYAQRMRFYVAAVESSNHAFMTVSPDSKITAWNPGAERLFGYSAEEAIGKDIAMIVPEDRREESRNIRERVHRLERVENLESVRLTKDGRLIHVVLEASPIKSPSGGMLGAAVVTRDVTAEKQAEEQFRMAVESCPSGMVMFDQTGRMVMVNSEMERLFGYQRDELIGRSVTILVPDGFQLSAGGNGAIAAVTTPERYRIGMRSDGTRFPVEVRQNTLHIRDGLLILGTVADISERLRNDRLKDEFVSTVSHELRTPLTSIAGSLGLLAGGAAGALPDPTMRLLKIAHKNSERLVRLINDILDIEKIESGKVVFDLKRVEIRGLVEQAIEANRGFADSFAVQVTLDDNAALAHVRADSDRLVQVLTNLLSNAAKFSPPNSEVTVGIESHADTVRITVRDRGLGIPEDFKPRIFEKFAQADATDARQKGGTGLGLSIVKQIVAFLGGTVGFEDAPGGGTIFYVDLPSWKLSGDTIAPDDTARGRVLICDDDASVAQTIAARLEREGFAPDVALTAADARSKACADGYASILMDLKLPDGDGISLIQELRGDERHENTPIVVISAEAERGRDDIRSASLDVLDWLNKPIDIRNLVDVLNRPLARNGGSRQHVLHIDDDTSVLAFVSEALAPHCDVVSVASLAQAREALTATQFSLVVLDLMLSQDSGLDILPELRGHDGTALPVILYSARASNGTYSSQVQAALNKSPQSIDHLILTLRKHMAGHNLPVTRKEVA